MQTVKIEPFKVIGIGVRTSNNNGEAARDIGALWNKFMNENIGDKIKTRVTEEIVSVYTNYESDHLKPYDTILGVKVSSLDDIPEGMVGASVNGGTYAKFISQGDLTKDAIYKTWMEVWNTPLNRSYTTDFELYGEKSINPTDGEAEILVAID